MAFLKFNKSELVNLSYSLKRELLGANKTGAYCNTSIVTCNTRRYHGLFAVTLDRFGGDRYLLLSSVDEVLIVDGKQFNLGIHCYGDTYEPRGHKYVVDFSADPVPEITFKVGEILFKKSILLMQDNDQVLIKYELLEAPSEATVLLKPFLAFRNIHALTSQNSEANTGYQNVQNGASFRMYPNFPFLNLQMSEKAAKFNYDPSWNYNITYSDEYRRGYDCKEDLFVPGAFEFKLKAGSSAVLSASLTEEDPAEFKKKFNSSTSKRHKIQTNRDWLVRNADLLVTNHNNRKKINAGYSWLYTGLLRETLFSLPGLVLYGLNSPEQFEEILDNLVADEQERLFRRTTQVEAPLYLASVLQKYIDFGADGKKVWKKYGIIIHGILESFLPGERREVSMQPNGLLWAQMDGVALTWMNAYVYGQAVTERPGFQVETNAFWYNTICFALEMEMKYGSKGSEFISKWTGIRDLAKSNFLKVFWNEEKSCLADFVDNNGQHLEIRPNQLFAIWVKHSPVDEELIPAVLKVIDTELVTARGIRSLSPRDPNYKGVYEGTQLERDSAYHQGCAFPFLLEQYVDICFRIKGKSFWKRAEWLQEGFFEDLSKHGVGSFSELYDGDPPHEPHGAISSALSTAALLYVDYLLEKNKD